MKPLRVAIVGAGKLGTTHARHWANVPGCTVAAAADTSRDAAQSLLTTHGTEGAQAFDTVIALLADCDADIIDICTPTPFHADAVLAAIDAERAVFVEKPLARTLSDCDAIVNAAAANGVPVGVAQVVRYFPAFKQAHSLVEQGVVGTPVTARLSRTASFPTRPGTAAGWYADFAQSGGVAFDASLHDVDWLLWCFGAVERVFAKGLYGQAQHAGVRDYVLATLRFKSGVVAHVEGSWAHAGGLKASLEVCGTTGLIEWNSAHQASVTLSTPGAPALMDSPLAPDDDPFYAEIADFARCVRQGLPPPVSAADGREAVRVALCILQSIETGKAITL